MNNRVDITDEALRIFYLESAKEANSNLAEREMDHILSNEPIKQVNHDLEKSLLIRLKSVLMDMSFGQMIQHQIASTNISEDILAERSHLSVEMIKEIIEDKIYANNIPVMILKDLLQSLHISYTKAERAIRKTFDILQQQHIETSSYSMFNPSFRKSIYISKEMMSDISPKTDGKELFENKVVLDKYLSRLNELLNE